MARRLRATLALALSWPGLGAAHSQTLAAPTPGDVTAIYRSSDRPGEVRVEVAANGDFRLQDNSAHYLLQIGDAAYDVSAGPGGPLVERVSDVAAARAREWSNVRETQTKLIAAGPVTIGGRTGMGYFSDDATAEGRARPWLVFSADRELATIGAAFATSHFGPDSPAFADLLRSGTPLRLGDIELQQVLHTPIPAGRLALPAMPATTAEVAEHHRLTPEHPTDKAMIRSAVFAQDALWLLYDRGALQRIAESGGARAASLPKPPPKARELCVLGDAPAVVALGRKQLSLWRLEGSAWRPLADVPSGADPLVALHCTGARATLLTTSRLIDFDTNGVHIVQLSESLPHSALAAVYDVGDFVLLGLDLGEWGGGLRRIDRATGQVRRIDSRGKKPCDGPLNGDCDPVRGIVPEPGKPGCFVLTIGLEHMSSHGRLAELCGDHVRSLYVKPYTIEVAPRTDGANDDWDRSVAFYGLAEGSAGLWAAGEDGLYRIGPADAIAFSKLPRFDTLDGVQLSFAVPGLVLVSKNMDARVSLGGEALLLVSR